MKLLSAQDILAARDLPEETVDVPEWGGSVRLVCMGALERIEWEQTAFKSKDEVNNDDFFFGLLRRSLRDENDQSLFADDDAVKELGKKNKDVLLRLHTVALKLNGSGPDGVGQIEKNSEASTADAGNGS